MLPTRNTLSANIRAQSVELLNKHLAAAIDLHGQTKQAHWNVRGPNFIAIHTLFDQVADKIEGYSDLIAASKHVPALKSFFDAASLDSEDKVDAVCDALRGLKAPK